MAFNVNTDTNYALFLTAYNAVLAQHKDEWLQLFIQYLINQVTLGTTLTTGVLQAALTAASQSLIGGARTF